MHVQHLQRRKFFQQTSRRQPAGHRPQFALQRHVQTIGQVSHEDVRFHALFLLVKDRSDLQIALEVFERRLDGHQLQIVFPERLRIGLRQVGAQQVAAFAPAPLPASLP